MKYHLKRYDIIADLPLPGAGYSNTFPYTSGENTDVDLAVDELGEWGRGESTIVGVFSEQGAESDITTMNCSCG